MADTSPDLILTKADRKRLKALIATIALDKRVFGAPGVTPGRDTERIAARLPGADVRALRALGGLLTHHIERAVKLYLEGIRGGQ